MFSIFLFILFSLYFLLNFLGIKYNLKVYNLKYIFYLKHCFFSDQLLEKYLLKDVSIKSYLLEEMISPDGGWEGRQWSIHYNLSHYAS